MLTNSAVLVNAVKISDKLTLIKLKTLQHYNLPTLQQKK